MRGDGVTIPPARLHTRCPPFQPPPYTKYSFIDVPRFACPLVPFVQQGVRFVISSLPPFFVDEFSSTIESEIFIIFVSSKYNIEYVIILQSLTIILSESSVIFLKENLDIQSIKNSLLHSLNSTIFHETNSFHPCSC